MKPLPFPLTSSFILTYFVNLDDCGALRKGLFPSPHSHVMPLQTQVVNTHLALLISTLPSGPLPWFSLFQNHSVSAMFCLCYLLPLLLSSVSAILCLCYPLSCYPLSLLNHNTHLQIFPLLLITSWSHISSLYLMDLFLFPGRSSSRMGTLLQLYTYFHPSGVSILSIPLHRTRRSSGSEAILQNPDSFEMYSRYPVCIAVKRAVLVSMKSCILVAYICNSPKVSPSLTRIINKEQLSYKRTNRQDRLLSLLCTTIEWERTLRYNRKCTLTL